MSDATLHWHIVTLNEVGTCPPLRYATIDDARAGLRDRIVKLRAEGILVTEQGADLAVAGMPPEISAVVPCTGARSANDT